MEQIFRVKFKELFGDLEKWWSLRSCDNFYFLKSTFKKNCWLQNFNKKFSVIRRFKINVLMCSKVFSKTAGHMT